MTLTCLITAAVAPRAWMFPVAFAAVLALQVGAWLAVEQIFKAVERRRKNGGRRAGS